VLSLLLAALILGGVSASAQNIVVIDRSQRAGASPQAGAGLPPPPPGPIVSRVIAAPGEQVTSRSVPATPAPPPPTPPVTTTVTPPYGPPPAPQPAPTPTASLAPRPPVPPAAAIPPPPGSPIATVTFASQSAELSVAAKADLDRLVKSANADRVRQVELRAY